MLTQHGVFALLGYGLSCHRGIVSGDAFKAFDQHINTGGK
jgi:hypothetical protein